MSTLLYKYYTGTSSDALSGTELDAPQMNGVLKAWFFSDNDTATVQVEQLGHKSGIANFIPITDSNATPDIKKIPYYTIPVRSGVRPIIVLGGTVSKIWAVYELVQSCALHQLHIKYHSATSADALASGELDTPIKSGTMLVWASSDVVTATIELFQQGHKVGRTSLLPYTNADGAIDISTQVPYQISVQQGVKPIISLGGTVQETYIVALVR